jgi:holliday junction DNA helicase RuvA
MIGKLKGIIDSYGEDSIVLDVNGVGYLVQATPTVLRRDSDQLTVETYLHVREDALQLYGFGSAEERDLFVHLLGVNGVGPKVALAIVSGSTPADLRRAIALEDTARFEAIPGIGKKTAQRVVLELKEKLGTAVDVPAPVTDLVARDALVELGYSVADAERALASVDPELPPEQRVREALQRAA